MSESEQNGISLEQYERQVALAQQRVVAGAASVRQEVNRRQSADPADGGFLDPEDARERIATADADTQREQFEWARDRLMTALVEVPGAYHDVFQVNREADPAASLRELIVLLHDPLVRESLLVAVAEPYEADARELLAEIAGMAWGLIETMAGQAGPHHRTYLRHLADYWDVDVDELAASMGMD